MSTGLRDLLGLPRKSDSSYQGQSDAEREYNRRFTEAIQRVNKSLRAAAPYAPSDEHLAANAQRESLILAHQKILKRFREDNAAAVQEDADRVLAAANLLHSSVSALADESVIGQEQWSQEMDAFEDSVGQIGELEDAGHSMAPALRKVADAILDRVSNRRFDDAASAAEQLRPKVAELVAAQQQFARPAAAPGNQAKVKVILVDAENVPPAPPNVVLPTPRSAKEFVFVSDTDNGVEPKMTRGEVVKSPDYVDNQIVNYRARPNWLPLTVDEVTIEYAAGSELVVPWKLIRLGSAGYADNYEITGGRIYPLDDRGDVLYDTTNTPNIVQIADWINEELALRKARRLEIAELVNTFAGAIAALGSIRSETARIGVQGGGSGKGGARPTSRRGSPKSSGGEHGGGGTGDSGGGGYPTKSGSGGGKKGGGSGKSRGGRYGEPDKSVKQRANRDRGGSRGANKPKDFENRNPQATPREREVGEMLADHLQDGTSAPIVKIETRAPQGRKGGGQTGDYYLLDKNGKTVATADLYETKLKDPQDIARQVIDQKNTQADIPVIDLKSPKTTTETARQIAKVIEETGNHGFTRLIFVKGRQVVLDVTLR
jgi:hypothetical protein